MFYRRKNNVNFTHAQYYSHLFCIILIGLICWSIPVLVPAEPVIGVIIDDMGDNLHRGMEIVDLNAPVTCSILPHQPYSRRLSDAAHAVGKSIILHTPMQPISDLNPGAGTLTVHMDKQQFIQTFRKDMTSLDFVNGINNHMGSLLTESPKQMRWLMQELKRLNLYFVDSRTIARSVAERIASSDHLRTTKRNIFLDDITTQDAIDKQLQKLVQYAKTHGSAIAIGHPHPETIASLKRWIATLPEQGVRVLPIAQIIARQKDQVLSVEPISKKPVVLASSAKRALSKQQPRKEPAHTNNRLQHKPLGAQQVDEKRSRTDKTSVISPSATRSFWLLSTVPPATYSSKSHTIETRAM